MFFLFLTCKVMHQVVSLLISFTCDNQYIMIMEGSHEFFYL